MYLIIAWSMIAAVCFTLSAIYGLVWYRNRTARAHLLFSLTAVAAGIWTFLELSMMRAESSEELLTTLRWAHVSLFFWLVSIAWFVRIYLAAGRRWLLWTYCGLRAFYLLLNFIVEPSINYREVPRLRHLEFLGASVTVPEGLPNPWTLLGHGAAVLLLVFVADATVTAWRRGDRRQAVMVGGAVQVLLLFGTLQGALRSWAGVEVPVVFSPLYLAIVAVMAYEMSHDVLRASELVRDLQVSDTVLRESQATLRANNQQISELFGRLIGAQETERRRIARDLHDDVSQRVAGLSIMISGLKRRLAGRPDEADIVLTLVTMQQHTSGLAEEIRVLSHDLHPGVLQHAGLVAALREYCAQFEKLYAVTVTFSADAGIENVEADLALCLYRVAQEALRNVAKHAGAHQVAVTLARTQDGFQLAIADDGKGFDLGERQRTGFGIGLVNIEERVRLLRGSVDFQTRPGSGTRVQVRMPRSREAS